ncbi:MAG: DUF2231 domain-containing protein [Ignavibacteriales bacterium]|nr:DUF2231 domain-containing protein [Ignavibacteriales bacterium]MCF8314934.1 DUF2231 domain-containing protein [Ignavibacteriales bacterium]MCF8436117.1 DUF2231 domain-containing protein [Ignavibacteriales bacterium]
MMDLEHLHPVIIHFPIVFLFVYPFLEFILLKKTGNPSIFSGLFVLAFGIVFAILAALTGNAAETVVITSLDPVKDKYIYDLIRTHSNFATYTILWYSLILIFQFYLIIKKKMSHRLKYIFIILALCGLYLIYMTGDQGGTLVFQYGIGTQLIK